MEAAAVQLERDPPETDMSDAMKSVEASERVKLREAVSPVFIQINSARALGIGASGVRHGVARQQLYRWKVPCAPFASRWAILLSFCLEPPRFGHRASTLAAKRRPSAAQVCSWSRQCQYSRSSSNTLSGNSQALSWIMRFSLTALGAEKYEIAALTALGVLDDFA